VILDVNPLELVILGGVALLVIPPKDLPRAMRFAGQWVGRARGLARQFRSGFDDMIREAEFAEMEKKWKAENERIMREFPQQSDFAQLPAPSDPAPVTIDHEPVDHAPVMVEQPVITSDPDAAASAEPVAPPAAKPRARKKPTASTANGTTAKAPARTRKKPAAPTEASLPGLDD